MIYFVACQNDAIIQDGNIYWLSDEKATVLQAELICQSMRGELAHINSENQNIFEKKVQNKYLSPGTVTNMLNKMK